MADLAIKVRNANWSNAKWKAEARFLISEARLHAEVSEKAGDHNKIAQQDAADFRSLEKDLRECRTCDAHVKRYYAVLERSWSHGG